MFVAELSPGFDFLSEEYAELFLHSQATAFQNPRWLSVFYERLVPQLEAFPLIVTVRQSGRLVMVLPLLRRRRHGLRTVEFADLGVSDYASPVASVVTVNAVATDRAARDRIRQLLRPYDILRIQKLRSSTDCVDALLGATPLTPMPVNAHAVALDPSFAEWRARNILASYRKELDKKSRQLQRKGRVVFEQAENGGSIEATLHRMQQFRRSRFDTGDLLQDPRYFEFYREVATRSCGSLARLYCLKLDGLPIAGVLGLSHNGSFLIILSGFDQENFKNQSLGSLMFEMVAQHCIQRGDRELDFTIGDEPYKERFGTQRSPVYQIVRSGSMAGVVAGTSAKLLPRIRRIASFLKAGPSP